MILDVPVLKHKEWALDDQYEDVNKFLGEYKRRYPSADWVPTGREQFLGVGVTERPVVYIPPEAQPSPPPKEVKKTAPKNVIQTCVCGKTVRSLVAIKSHQGACQEYLMTRG